MSICYPTFRLLSETQKQAFPPPTSKENIDAYLSWDDWRVLGLLSQGKSNEAGMILRHRQHHRCIHSTPEVPNESDLDKANEILRELSNLVGFVDEAQKSWYNADEEDIMIAKRQGMQEHVFPLSSISSIVKGLVPVRQRRIYVPVANKKTAEQILKKYLEGN